MNNQSIEKSINVDKKIAENVKALFLNENYIREQPHIIKRIDNYSWRYYLKIYDDKHYITGAGVTSIIGAEFPKDKILINWQNEMSAKNGPFYVEWLLEHSANYGTFLHDMYAMLLIGNTIKFDIDSMMQLMEIFYIKNNYDFQEGMKWYKQEGRNVQKDIICFIQWVKDYNIIPVAIEYPFVCETEIGNYAGTIDLVAKATFKDKQKTILVDIKSGKNFFESHELQLYAYKQAWEKENTDLLIDEFYNFSPKDFRMKAGKEIKPTYNFKNQTNSQIAFRWDYYLKLFYTKEERRGLLPRIDFKIDSINISTDIYGAFIEYNPIEKALKEAF